MTGSGVARDATELGDVVVEVRSVNGRNLAVKTRLAPACQGLEIELEKLVRERLRRGTVTVLVDVVAPAPSDAPVLDLPCAARAAEQLRELARQLGLAEPTLADVLLVPGVLPSAAPAVRVSRQLPPRLRALVEAALAALIEHRQHEGASTAAAVREQLASLAALREQAAIRMPAVVAQYRARLVQRVNELLAGQGRVLEDADVVREVALFADRTDAGEELQRLEAHLDQARRLLEAGGEVGRKLEFLAQEMLRETNTLGSKAQDAELAVTVVEMKAAVDRIKEQAPNLE